MTYVPPKKFKKIAILSNGFGEDQIACNLIQALWKVDPSAEIVACPLVGEGKEYEAIGITPIFQNKPFPSGGFLRQAKPVLKDLQQGLVKHHLSQLKHLKTHKDEVELCLVIGDVFGLIMAKLAGIGPRFFIPTAKSDLFMPHSLLERFLIKKYAKKVYTRDQLTATNLSKKGVPATYLGNAMMDHLSVTDSPFQFSKEDYVISIVPGSREEAYENTLLCFKLANDLFKENDSYTFILAKAQSIDLIRLKNLLSENGWKLVYQKPHLCFHQQQSKQSISISDNFTDAISPSTAVIGLAGTANEQAVYLGKQVICFEGAGPQSSKVRFEEQSQLLGEKLHFIPERNHHKRVNHIHTLLTEWKGLQEMSKHIPKAGPRIVTDLLETLYKVS